MKDVKAATEVFEAIHHALAATDKTREPMNALVVWTELGRGLAGTLDRQGADVGLLGRLVEGYCRERAGAGEVDLDRWIYRVPPEARLGKDELGAALGRVQRAIEERLCSGWGDTSGEERRRELFLATVRGWFPVGLDIVRSLPAASQAAPEAAHAALRAWCARYLPKDPAGPGDLGVRMERPS